MTDDDRTKASLEAASEAIKQLLTLATASIGASIALFNRIKTAGVDFGAHARAVQIGLGFLALSVAFGLLALGALTGQLGNVSVARPSAYAAPVRWGHFGQMVAFAIGIGAIVVAAIS